MAVEDVDLGRSGDVLPKGTMFSVVEATSNIFNQYQQGSLFTIKIEGQEQKITLNPSVGFLQNIELLN